MLGILLVHQYLYAPLSQVAPAHLEAIRISIQNLRVSLRLTYLYMLQSCSLYWFIKFQGNVKLFQLW